MALKNSITTSDYLPYVEYERLLSKLREDEDYYMEMFARLSFCTACRISDVLNLKWGDILNQTHSVVVEKKTGKSRVVMFNPSVRAKLNELWHLMGCPEKDKYIFETPWSKGLPASRQSINRNLKRLKAKYRLKIGNFSSHTFRKTFGRFVYEKNNKSAESLLLLNKILRHGSLNVTKVYIGITQDEINDIFNSIQF